MQFVRLAKELFKRTQFEGTELFSSSFDLEHIGLAARVHVWVRRQKEHQIGLERIQHATSKHVSLELFKVETTTSLKRSFVALRKNIRQTIVVEHGETVLERFFRGKMRNSTRRFKLLSPDKLMALQKVINDRVEF